MKIGKKMVAIFKRTKGLNQKWVSTADFGPAKPTGKKSVLIKKPMIVEGQVWDKGQTVESEDDCQICRKHPIKHRDYRQLDNCGLQGKVLVCEWCVGLNDVAISDIIRDELNPKTFYNEEDE